VAFVIAKAANRLYGIKSQTVPKGVSGIFGMDSSATGRKAHDSAAGSPSRALEIRQNPRLSMILVLFSVTPEQ
jgi:hypothetical protein